MSNTLMAQLTNNGLAIKKHKWGEAFEHDDTYWSRCMNCGLWRIYLTSIAYYSPDGVLGHTSTIRPNCQPKTKAEQEAVADE